MSRSLTDRHLRWAGCLVLACAAILRLWAWNSIGLDHFDEGGYAMTARALAEGSFATERYPLQHWLSPPFQFGTAGLLMLLTGVSDGALMSVSAVLGVATVGLVFGCTLRWFGRAEAVTAAGLVALADFHILYSRAGLTDVAFGFWFLMALWCFAHAEQRRSWGWAVLAGIATGVAWNTKYHGWLAVAVAGLVVLPMLSERDRGAFARAVGRIAAAGAVAAAIYLPWALFVMEQEGGYAAVAAEHAHYLRPTRALQQTWTHINTQLYLDGWLGRLAPGGLALWLASGASMEGRKAALRRAGMIGIVGIIMGSTLFLGLAAIAAFAGLLHHRDPGVRTALSFFVVFSLLTPLYTPYPRLVIPWMLAAAILAGPAMVRLVLGAGAEGVNVRWGFAKPGLRVAAAGGVLALAVVAFSLRPPWQAAQTFRPKDGFRRAAAELAPRMSADAVVVVWGEPGVVFYLRDRFTDVHHINDVRELAEHSDPRRPLYLVTSIYAGRIGGEFGLRQWSPANPSVLNEVMAAPVRAISDVRLLDDFGPAGAERFLAGEEKEYDLRLFSVTLTDPVP